MKIEKISINKIVPNPWNPNKMPDGTFKKLKLSIQKFGIFNPILVRPKGKEYEIIDGEWRWRAYTSMNMLEIPCRVMEATDNEVKQMIFSSTIKGKHNAYESQQMLHDFLDDTSNSDLNACNLDKNKLERKTKYRHFKKGEAVQKGQGKKLVDESYGLNEITEYSPILAITLDRKSYDKVIAKLLSIDKDISKAFLSLIDKL